jgi:hypothetical protein
LGLGVGVRLNIRFNFNRFFIGDNLETIISEEVVNLLFIHGHRFCRFGFLIQGAEFVHQRERVDIWLTIRDRRSSSIQKAREGASIPGEKGSVDI